jgi:hypothetical protein
MQHPDFRYKGKVFATLDYPEKGWGMIKLTPDQQRSCLSRAPSVFQPASGAWGKSGSTVVQLKSAPKTLVNAALSAAFSNVAALKQRANQSTHPAISAGTPGASQPALHP